MSGQSIPEVLGENMPTTTLSQRQEVIAKAKPYWDTETITIKQMSGSQDLGDHEPGILNLYFFLFFVCLFLQATQNLYISMLGHLPTGWLWCSIIINLNSSRAYSGCHEAEGAEKVRKLWLGTSILLGIRSMHWNRSAGLPEVINFAWAPQWWKPNLLSCQNELDYWPHV